MVVNVHSSLRLDHVPDHRLDHRCTLESQAETRRWVCGRGEVPTQVNSSRRFDTVCKRLFRLLRTLLTRLALSPCPDVIYGAARSTPSNVINTNDLQDHKTVIPLILAQRTLVLQFIIAATITFVKTNSRL